MLFIVKEVRTSLPLRAIKRCFLETLRVARIRGERDASIIFVSRKKIRKLYAKYAGINKATTVLSFPWQDSRTPSNIEYLGEVFISPAVVREKFYVEGYQAGLRRVVVHATLHLLGFDHASKKDAQAMTLLEEKILNNHSS